MLFVFVPVSRQSAKIGPTTRPTLIIWYQQLGCHGFDPLSTPFTPSIFLVLEKFKKIPPKIAKKGFRPVSRFVEFFVDLIHGCVALGPFPTFYSSTICDFNRKISGLEEKFEIPQNSRKIQKKNYALDFVADLLLLFFLVLGDPIRVIQSSTRSQRRLLRRYIIGST